MKYRLKNLFFLLVRAWYSPLLLPYFLTDQAKVIGLDLTRWLSIRERKERGARGLLWLLARLPEFRSLYYYRLRQGNLKGLALGYLLSRLYPGCSTLSIFSEKIGPGLFIQHGIATIIAASQIGANCWINQQVTIGYSNSDDCPRLGDNVSIFAGAKVIGNVTIGDYSIVGANAVVVKDVPPNCTVVGVPAYIVKRDGVKVREPL